ncbi:hypothetical protein BD779DRAFT_1666490 [Infundibulicybe gibba]|nr:hypothetical protein BD779DRAFT_1666490 [Infundibulicybe gibba]
MSVATKNPFALLDEGASRPSSPTPAKSEPPAPPAPSRANQKPRTGPAARGGKYYARGGKPQRDSTTQAQDDPPPIDSQRKSDGRGRGRGGRGGQGGSGGAPRGRRPFDRHSQTGKTDSDKKIHQSWGGDDGNAELKTEQAATTDAAAEGEWTADANAADAWATPTADADAWAAPPADAAAAAAPDADKPEREGRPRREREPEEEDNTLTLEQYLAQQKEKENSVIPKLEGTRKANEGADANIWKDVVPLSKNEDEEAYFAGKSKSAPKARAKKEEKVYLEIDARFDRPDRGGRGRGGRGGERGRGGPARGRGAPRGGRSGPGNATINVDDQNAFPSLS